MTSPPFSSDLKNRVNFWLETIIGGILADISVLLGYSTNAIVLLLLMIFFISVQKKIELDKLKKLIGSLILQTPLYITKKVKVLILKIK